MFPKIFLIISLVELPKGRKYGETEDIIIPASPGTIAPPKKNKMKSRPQFT